MGSYEPHSAAADALVQDYNDILRVGIVGSGLSGLVAAYLLCSELESTSLDDDDDSIGDAVSLPQVPRRPRTVEVHLFERADRLGLDSKSITIQTGKQHDAVRVDVPMRSFNVGYYPETCALYQRLGIPVRPTNFTYAFTSLPSSSEAAGTTSPKTSRAPHPSLLYNGASGLKGFGIPHHIAPVPTLSTLASTVRSPVQSTAHLAREIARSWTSTFDYLRVVALYTFSYLHLLLLALWHHYVGNTTDPRHPLGRQTLSDFCISHRLSSDFIDVLIVSMFSAVMTAQAESVRQAPAAEVLAYIARTAFRDHCTVATGVGVVEAALVRRLPPSHIHTGATVVGLRPSTSQRGTACLSVQQAGQETMVDYDGFHHVIFATQANQSAAFIAGYAEAVRRSNDRRHTEQRTAEEEREWAGAVASEAERLDEMAQRLGVFRYEESVVINHTDRSVLPNEVDWRDLNLVSPAPRLNDALRKRKQAGQPASGRNNRDASVKALKGLSDDTHTMATHILRRSHRSDAHQSLSPVSPGDSCDTGELDDDHENVTAPLVLQTTNPLRSLTPHKDSILSVSRFERVILTPEGKAAQKELFSWRRARRAPRTSEERWWSANAREVWKAQRRSEAKRKGLPPPPDDSGTWSSLKNAARTYLGTTISERWTLELGPLQGGSDPRFAGIWASGSWGPGIPLLEGCVTTSRLVVSDLLEREGLTYAQPPWV